MDFLIIQFFNFLIAIAIGLIIGFLFDIYRGLWKKSALTSRAMPFWDLFWWIIVTALVFLILLNLNWGQLRLYLFLGQIVGFVFYRKKISPYFLKNFIDFLYWMEKALKRMIIIIMVPLRLIIKIIIFPFYVIRLLLHRTGRVLKKIQWVVLLVFRGIARKCKKIIKKLFKISRNKK